MSHIYYIQGLLMNLRGELERNRAYLSKERARQELVKLTGQDFGYDADHWREWLNEAKARGDQRFQEPF